MDQWLNQRTLFGKLVFIYQMPKTGSQTVEATLRASGIPHHIIRLHYLSEQRAADIRRGPAHNLDPRHWEQVAAIQLGAMARVRKLLRTRKLLRACLLPIPKIDVISAVREPIGSALSSIFENHSLFFANLDSVAPEGCAEIVQRPRMMGSYQNWLDTETMPLLGIDVFQRPFAREQGYAVYENRFARLLLYRFEALDKLPQMLKDFLGCNIGPMVNVNLGTSKPYAEVYASIKKRLRLPAEFVNAQYSSKMMRHFYSAEELQALRSRWCAAVSERQPVLQS